MREYIFTEKEREMLREWIRDGKETKPLQNMFSRMRRTKPTMIDDIKLYLEARRRLVAQRRWRLFVQRGAYGQPPDGHGSTPRRKGHRT